MNRDIELKNSLIVIRAERWPIVWKKRIILSDEG